MRPRNPSFVVRHLPVVAMDSGGPSSSHTKGAMPCSSSTAALLPGLPKHSSASAQAARSTEGGCSGMSPVSGVARCNSLRNAYVSETMASA